VLKKVLFNLIKENHGLHEKYVIEEHMIPTTFHEATEFLNDSNLNSLKHHYMTFNWTLSKDSMYHDSLIGSKIRTRSQKNISG
jgi:hypothetical protein